MNNKAIVRVLVALGLELAIALLVWLIIVITHGQLIERIGWFGAVLVGPLLMLRHYARKKEDRDTIKGLATLLFVSAIVFFFFFLKYNPLS